LVYQNQKLVVSDSTPAVSQDKFGDLTSSVTDTLREAFLDEVFGNNSKLERAEWEKQVAGPGKWLLSSKEIRARAEKEL
jgi:hypothetical protein